MFKNKEPRSKRHESEHEAAEAGDDQILTKYELELDRIKRESVFLSDTPSRCVPYFGLEEIELGAVLGVGGFCAVREVKEIRLDPSLAHLQPEFQVKDAEFYQTETRKYMEGNLIRDNSSRYAVKSLKRKFEEEKHRYRGMLDLAIEAEFLSHLAHPNIIKMRGSLVSDSAVRDPAFFIVLDRLHETLQQKIDDVWPKQYKGMLGPFKLGKDKNKLRRVFLDRLLVAHDLSTVFRYLHSKG